MAQKLSRVSLRAFAGRLHVSHTAVEKALRTGRLSKSIRRDSRGRPYVADQKAAVLEWRAGASKPKGNGKGTADTLTEAQRQVAVERARGLRLANRQKTGTLIEAEAARREAFECARTVRDSILNVPARVSAELAAENDGARVHARLDAELRKALESLAETLAHGDE